MAGTTLEHILNEALLQRLSSQQSQQSSAALAVSTVIRLKNMVAVGEADAMFKEEVAEEMQKFGTVVGVVIHQSGQDTGGVKVFVRCGPCILKGTGCPLLDMFGRAIGLRNVPRRHERSQSSTTDFLEAR